MNITSVVPWLKSLKRGDRILSGTCESAGSPVHHTMVTVDDNFDGRILIGERLFDPTGYSKELDAKLEPVTEQFLEQCERERIYRKVIDHFGAGFDYLGIPLTFLFRDELSTSTIKQILDLIGIKYTEE